MTTLLWVDPSNLVFNLQGTLTNRQVKYLPSGSFELTLIFGDVRIESTSIGAAQAAPFYGQCFLLPSLRLLGEVKTISFSCRLGNAVSHAAVAQLVVESEDSNILKVSI